MTNDSNWDELQRQAFGEVENVGFRFIAPAGTAVPIATVNGGSFVDTWPMAWLSLGEPLFNTPMQRLVSYQRAMGDAVLNEVGRTQDWLAVDIPGGSIAIMLGWESVASDLRIVSQGAIDTAYFDSLTREMYAR
jgi:hypothetical protein